MGLCKNNNPIRILILHREVDSIEALNSQVTKCIKYLEDEHKGKLLNFS